VQSIRIAHRLRARRPLAIRRRPDDARAVRASRSALTFGFSTALAVSVAGAAVGSGCSVSRATSSPPSYDDAIGPLLVERCVACHGTEAPAGGWRATSYLEAVACVAESRPAVLPADEGAPIVRVLANATHAPLLSVSERDVIVAWVRAGSPKFGGSAHAPSFVDPRSPESHGRVLRSKRWSPMLDPNDAASCGRCHDGAPSRPDGVTSSAPGAPACTTCHQEPGGALGCNTCHGRGTGVGTSAALSAKPYPPRDPCFFPDDAALATAHAAHVDGSATHANGLPCATCHPVPGATVIGGAHGNGTVDVRLDEAIAGPSATFDASSKACTTTCHARAGGARPAPAWSDKTAMTCGDCHGSPPPGHLAGACTGCHRETNATGTAFLSAATLHVNGRVDLGDGSGACGACHGRGDDPWPSTNAHPAHERPAAAQAVACASCHAVPSTFGAGTPHPRGGAATVALMGLAVARAAPAAYAAGSCRDVYCHGAGLEGTVAASPAWSDTSGAGRACGTCHGTPPAAPHVASPTCDLCHRDAVVTAAGAAIAPAWARLHVNGEVDRGGN
jgi:predicted CxxxxCH...CXXCH cytochrome family protein